MNYSIYKPDNYLQLMEKYHLNSLQAKIAEASGWQEDKIKDIFTAPSFFDNGKDENLLKIKERILTAKKQNEKVFVAGDYDCDGICGTTIMVKLLNELGIKNGYYIPNRLTEGYGLNIVRTKQAIEKGYSLIITVDNGVMAKEALEYCQGNNLDVIVLDHHQIQQEVACYAMFHPQLCPDSRKWLCGGGCALEVARMFPEIKLDTYLILAMVATIGDMMEMLGENRAIVKEGIQALKQIDNNPIKALVPNGKLINEDNISYYVVPKLNAVGRLADKYNVNSLVEFLASEDPRLIEQYVEKLLVINEERRRLTEQGVEELSYNQDDDFLLVKKDNLHLGIIGLVANKLCHDVNKPVMVSTNSKEGITASLRAPEGFDLMECLSGIKELFTAFGGHAQAAGISFREENYEKVSSYLKNYEVTYQKKDKIAVAVTLDDLSKQNCAELLNNRPFGMSTRLPELYLENPQVINYRSLSKPNYLKWEFDNGFYALSFLNEYSFDSFNRSSKLSFIGSLQENEYRGNINYGIQVISIVQNE